MAPEGSGANFSDSLRSLQCSMTLDGSGATLSNSFRPLQCYCTKFFPPGGHVDMSFCVVVQVALKGRKRLSQAAHTIIAQGF